MCKQTRWRTVNFSLNRVVFTGLQFGPRAGSWARPADLFYFWCSWQRSAARISLCLSYRFWHRQTWPSSWVIYYTADNESDRPEMREAQTSLAFLKNRSGPSVFVSQIGSSTKGDGSAFSGYIATLKKCLCSHVNIFCLIKGLRSIKTTVRCEKDTTSWVTKLRAVQKLNLEYKILLQAGLLESVHALSLQQWGVDILTVLVFLNSVS